MYRIALFLILSLQGSLFAQASAEQLAEAATHHRVAEMEKLLQSPGAKANLEIETGFFQSTPLFKAVDNAYGPHDSAAVQTIRLLLDAGADIHYSDKYGTGILHLAADAGMDWLVKICLDSGCDPNAFSEIHDMPLMVAFVRGRNEVIDLLVNGGADPTYVNSFGESYLHWAARHKADRWVFWQLEKGGDMLKENKFHQSAAYLYLNAGGTNPALFKIFSQPDQVSGKMILLAVSNNRTDWLDYLLEQNIDLESFAETDLVAFAATNHHPECLKYLLNKGFLPNRKVAAGMEPIHFAAIARDVKVVEILLKAGVDPKAKTTDGSTPLHLHPWIDMEEEEIKSRSRAYQEPVASPIPVFELLLASGADINAKDQNGHTPYDLAIEHLEKNGNGHLWYDAELRKFFKKHGGKTSAK